MRNQKLKMETPATPKRGRKTQGSNSDPTRKAVKTRKPLVFKYLGKKPKNCYSLGDTGPQLAEVIRKHHAWQKTVRGQLIAEARLKPIIAVCQIDVGTTEDDGDCVNCERKLELGTIGKETVRIQFPIGVNPSEAVRVLRKTADWIEYRPNLVTDCYRG